MFFPILFEGLHCESLPLPTVVHDFEQLTMLTSANGAANAFGMGPSAGYNSFPEFFTFVTMISMLLLHVVATVASSIHAFTNLLLCYFWIKSIFKLTDCRKLTVEVCTHAVQNERWLPLRAVLQVIFFKQLQLIFFEQPAGVRLTRATWWRPGWG